MGWLTTHKPKGETLKEFFTKTFHYPEHPAAGLVDIASRGWTEAYAAVRHPQGFIFGVAIQLRYTREEYDNFSYRTDDETVGPHHAQMPQRILDKLTPDAEMISRYGEKAGGYWQEWRERCRENAKHQTAASNAQRADGDVIQFSEPMQFTDGTTQDIFVLRRERTPRGGIQTRFKPVTIINDNELRERWGNYQISKWRSREHEVIGSIPRPAT